MIDGRVNMVHPHHDYCMLRELLQRFRENDVR